MKQFCTIFLLAVVLFSCSRDPDFEKKDDTSKPKSTSDLDSCVKEQNVNSSKSDANDNEIAETLKTTDDQNKTDKITEMDDVAIDSTIIFYNDNFMLGAEYQRQGQFTKAIAKYIEASKYATNDTLTQALHDSYKSNADHLFINKDYHGALSAIEHADSIMQNPNYILFKGKCMYFIGDYNKSRSYLLNVFDSNKGEAEYFVGLGFMQERTYENAILHFEEALKSGSSTNDCIIQLGNSYFALQNYEEANKYYQQVLSMDPDNETIKEQFEKTRTLLEEERLRRRKKEREKEMEL